MRPELNAILVIDKPEACSSAKAVAIVKRITGVRKIGHTGTLDPFATGVLVCCLNQATRLARFLLQGRKKYDAVLHLGIETDTQDKTGRIIAEAETKNCSQAQIAEAFDCFRGAIEQSPPAFSALKHAGVPLYKLARKGNPIFKPARVMQIYELRILKIAQPEVHFEVICSAGTYVRTLCADIGRKLGCGGHLKSLRRLQSSGFGIETALTLETLKERVNAGRLGESIVSMEAALTEIPAVIADQRVIENLLHGRPLTVADLPLTAPDDQPSTFVQVLDAGRRLKAVLEYGKSGQRYDYCCVFTSEIAE
jgi:tRNA pseudouridine55 synthase